MLMLGPQGFYPNSNKGIWLLALVRKALRFSNLSNTFTKIHPNTISNKPYIWVKFIIHLIVARDCVLLQGGFPLVIRSLSEP